MRYILRRALLGRERGQALILFAAGLVGFCALVGMSIDVGQVVYQRTDLQKVSDAAALAGAQDLPLAGTAVVSANTYVSNNGGASCQPNCASVNAANDTITVTATRHVNFYFLQVIGLSGTDVQASAVARSLVSTGFSFSNPAIFPYAVWGGNPSYPSCNIPYGMCPGSSRTYRSNSWDNQVANSEKQNGDWSVPGNNFKGYFNTSNQQQQVYQADPSTQYSFGGNAVGQEPIDSLHQHYLTGTPIIVPVITKGNCTNNCGTLNFTIVAWVALTLNQDPATTNGTWTGTVVAGASAPDGVGGGYNPGSNYPTVRTTTLTQ